MSLLDLIAGQNARVPLRADAPPANVSVPMQDIARVRGQNAIVLRLLRAGPRTNVELAAVSLKYTSRISELRAYLRPLGSDIRCDRLHGGVTRYTLVTAA